MSKTLRMLIRFAWCFVGVVLAAYGSFSMDGYGDKPLTAMLPRPGFWCFVVGSVIVAIAFIPTRSRPSTRPTPKLGSPAESGPPAKPVSPEPVKPEPVSAEPTDTRRDRLTFVEVVGLAAGGVIGSGWLHAVQDLHQTLGTSALAGWALGGALMLTVAVVMVEFGLTSQRTGGLLFHPHDAFGPLVVIVLAASLWISYAINPAAQAAATVNGLGEIVPRLTDAGGLTLQGSALAIVIMTAILAFVLLPRRLVLLTNAALTLAKISIPVVFVGCLLLATSGTIEGPSPALVPSGGVLSALITSGVIYAYIGFQAPLDVTGEIRGTPRAVAKRVRWAVYGTVVGSFLLYSALQVVYDSHMAASGAEPGTTYAQLADAATLAGTRLDWLVVLVRLGAIIAPIGSGIVFTYALSREVYALSAERYVPSGLHESWATRIGRSRSDAFWLILGVNLVLALVVLVAVGGDWQTLAVLNTIPILVLYAVSCVVLAVRSDLLRGRVRRLVLPFAAWAGFVGIALVVNESAWDRVWKGMAVIGWGSLVLLVLPWLSHLQVPGFGWYDARNHGARLLQHDPANRPFLVLAGYLALLTALSALRHQIHDTSLWSVWSLRLLVAVVASGAFMVLFDAGRRYLRTVRP